MQITKSDWILLILRKQPLDRIHIMKSLFLIERNAKKKIQGYFQFEPYLYGPCSLDVYSELRNLLAHGFIVQPPQPMQAWANYYLTEQGCIKAKEISEKINSENINLIDKTVDEIKNLGFFELLKKVYSEAPEFTTNSVLKEVIKQ